MAAALEILDELYEQLVAAARARTERVPTPAVQTATVQLVFARHYARLERFDHAKRLLADARALLAVDPVHDLLLAIASGATAALAPRLLGLERHERYAVDLFCERARILDVGDGDGLGAIERFALDGTTVADRDAGAEQDSRDMLAEIHTTTGDVDAQIITLARNNRALSAEGKHRLFEPTLDIIERVSDDSRGFVYALAIEAAVEVAPARLVALVERALPTLPVLRLEIVPLLNVLVDALGTTHPHLLAMLWRVLPLAAHTEPQYIAGLIRIGDPHAFARYDAFVAGAGPATGVALRRAVLDHYLALPLAERFTKPWLVPLFARTADAVGTNYYFSASVVELVDSVVRSVVENGPR